MSAASSVHLQARISSATKLPSLMAVICLQVYTAGGRRLLPPVQLGGRPAFLAAAAPWRLLAVAAGGALWVWDLAALAVEVHGSASPLLALAPARGEYCNHCSL